MKGEGVGKIEEDRKKIPCRTGKLANRKNVDLIDYGITRPVIQVCFLRHSCEDSSKNKTSPDDASFVASNSLKRTSH